MLEEQRSKIFDRLVEGSLLRQMLNHWALLYEISEMIDILNIGGEPIFERNKDTHTTAGFIHYRVKVFLRRR